jgi:23S rRNA pseudouridine1911/1915/1917 synthase
MYRFGQLSQAGGPLRPGIVHRLDKDTSGVMVVARNDAAHRALAEQFRARRVKKTYVALVHGCMNQDSGTIRLPVARDLKRRVRMTTRRAAGREARTDWRVLARLHGFTLVAARIHTGRTHQIRVHFAALGHPVAGDTLYGAPRSSGRRSAALPSAPRNFLHAARIRFQHPSRAGEFVEVAAPLPAELAGFLMSLAQGSPSGAEKTVAAANDVRW